MTWATAILLLEPEISPLAWATVSVHSPVMIPLRLPSVLKKLFSPNDLHFKIALTGCPNEYPKEYSMHELGIMGMTVPHLESDRCVSCRGLCKSLQKEIC